MKILALSLLIALSSCQYLMSPVAIEIEEELALEAIKLLEHELEKK